VGECGRVGFVLRQGGFDRDRLRWSVRIDQPVALAAPEAAHSRADPAITSGELALTEHSGLANQGDAVSG
jgi:hypothetical protein